MITAPYNFVPLSKKVFFPDWADQVSHDVPFADGISGELECELTTHTPIYVRNGGDLDHDKIMNDEEAQSFFYVTVDDKRTFMIPGTSIKGMLRNVVEIASFGKLRRVDNNRYSVRDFDNPELYTNHMKNVKAAWLEKNKETGDWELIPCQYALINHDLLQQEEIKKEQSSVSKYGIWKDEIRKVKCIIVSEKGINKVKKIEEGDTLGELVFTGQPSTNDGKKGVKKNEFVFFNKKTNERIKITKNQIEDFNFIHRDQKGRNSKKDLNKYNPNVEWAFWKKVLDSGGSVPVFYQGTSNKVESFGLTRMYRLPYKLSVSETISNTSKDHLSEKPDLAESIFGFVDEEKFLKGRVSISAAMVVNGTAHPFDQAVTAILGSPKASYYPNYIKQMGSDGVLNQNTQYKTFMDPNCEIRGWKRYPARPLDAVEKPSGIGKNDDVGTKFIPLKENARFKFKIKIHNLKPVEVGAIVWSLTWGGDKNLRHSLGMGKSLGYGVVDIAVTSANLYDMKDGSVDWRKTMTDFEEFMDQTVVKKWKKTSEMVQLLAMANPVVKPACGTLRHLVLDPERKIDQFRDAKSSTPKKYLCEHLKEPAASAFSDVETETWTSVFLTFKAGQGLLFVTGPDNGKGECSLNSIILPEEVIARLKKGKAIKGNVTVQKKGGNQWTIQSAEVVPS